MPSKSNAKTLASKNQQKTPNAKTSLEANLTAGGNPNIGHSKPTQPPERPAPSTNTRKTSPPIDPTSETSAIATTNSAQDHISKEAGVNKKKQKRRMKEAAKRAAEQSSTGDVKLVQQSLSDAYSTLLSFMQSGRTID